ncbi:MAG: oxygenase MpaB family protein [Nannocystaceae bacterium]
MRSSATTTPPLASGTTRTPRPRPRVDFSSPPGAPALFAPSSITWHVFKNPVSLFIGGIAAVLLELGEPRVRTGVWEHSIFPTDPITRMRRTGMVSFVCAYAPREVAETTIAGVVAMHARVRGETPGGQPYQANDPELLDWVQATASFGFMEAYAAYCRPLSDAQRDQFYAESRASAALFGATGSPRSLAEQRALFDAMRTKLAPHPIVREFLEIVAQNPSLPPPLRPLQASMIRAAVDLLPDWVIARLELGDLALGRWEQRLLAAAGRLGAVGLVPVPP